MLVLMALSATVIFGFIGLALDVGQLQWTRVRAQTAADSAVLAGIEQRIKGGTNDEVAGAARYLAELNGFKSGANGATVMVNVPPTSGSLAGNPNAIEAVVQRNVPAFFLGFLGKSMSTVAARSVGRLGPGGGCIYALNKTANDALNFSGSQVTNLSCDAISESNSASSFSMNGSSNIYLNNGARVGMVGGYLLGGTTAVLEVPSMNAKPPVQVDDPGDPLAWKAAPSFAGMPYYVNGKFTKNSKPGGGTAIPPGVYCGGLDIGDTGAQTFTMNGLYVMVGGGFNVSSQANLVGSNVTIYLTDGPRSGTTCNQGYDGVTINGGGTLSLEAPTSGPMEGILMFQDRGIVSTKDNTINGNSTSTFDGAIYLKNSPVKFNGNNKIGGYLVLVADTIQVTGNSRLDANYTNLEGGTPIRTKATVVE